MTKQLAASNATSPRKTFRQAGRVMLAAAVCLGFMLAIATRLAMQDFGNSLVPFNSTTKPRVLARDGTPLNLSLQNTWNTDDMIALQDVPPFLQTALVLSEDQRFYSHHGVDWSARFAAIWQNLKARAAVRGASTITEQVVRMLHPRPRTLWSRWVEGFEARALELRFSKTQLLEFYLNQAPYADRRRGVVQAARLYFDRSLDTLNQAEMLSLVVLLRSPAGMDLRKRQQRSLRAIEQLADRLWAQNHLTLEQKNVIATSQLILSPARLSLDARHFVAHVLDTVDKNNRSTSAVASQVRTTLDPYFQRMSQDILDAALENLAHRHVKDGALIVIDHARNEILAWAVGKNAGSASADATAIGYDGILTPRQPGSTIKPFLYAMALEKGWTAATLIDDSELSEAIGSGVHTFRNYSRVHYGPIRMREALGNSLNIPAVRTLKFIGDNHFLDRLHALGISSLRQHPDFYGDGLALGNGELSLLELAQAYTVFARQGKFLPVTLLQDHALARSETTIFTPEVASLIANILADPDARQREFGAGLQFPIETAIKTGTSSDYRDAWAVAFDYSHTVAVWMGNLSGQPMNGITGAVGPAMVLRSVFSTLNRNQETRGLWLSPRLQTRSICRDSGLPAEAGCQATNEWFEPGTPMPTDKKLAAVRKYKLLQPTPGLLVARDPRIPPNLEALTMSLEPASGVREVEWNVDGRVMARSASNKFSWPLANGTHEVYARIRTEYENQPQTTDVVRFYVR